VKCEVTDAKRKKTRRTMKVSNGTSVCIKQWLDKCHVFLDDFL
jgi:hypothetical protein